MVVEVDGQISISIYNISPSSRTGGCTDPLLVRDSTVTWTLWNELGAFDSSIVKLKTSGIILETNYQRRHHVLTSLIIVPSNA